MQHQQGMIEVAFSVLDLQDLPAFIGVVMPGEIEVGRKEQTSRHENRDAQQPQDGPTGAATEVGSGLWRMEQLAIRFRA
jgi:hypothetical protein